MQQQHIYVDKLARGLLPHMRVTYMMVLAAAVLSLPAHTELHAWV